MELSRSTWLITSLSPGGGEKMSKRAIPAGDIAGLMTPLGLIKDKAWARTGETTRSSRSRRQGSMARRCFVPCWLISGAIPGYARWCALQAWKKRIAVATAASDGR
jgi:hypothetical protein